MLLDILIFIPMLIFICLGFRDGIVRKVVAIITLIICLFLGHFYAQQVGQFLVKSNIVAPADSHMYGFLTVFIGIFLLQSLLYRLITKNYKIGGIADKIVGVFLGFVEGAIFISSMLYILKFGGFPDRETARDTRFYKAFVNIAPQILDIPEAINPIPEKEKGIKK